MKKNHLLIITTALLSLQLTVKAQNWLIAGNSNIDTSKFLGTTNSQPFIVKTNKAERMRILANGRVGIGTAKPENKLHVFKGSAGSVTGWIDAPLIVENSVNSYIQLLAPEANATGILFGKPSSNLSGGIFYNDISHNANGFDFRNNGNITQMVLNNQGTLGIGTLSPSTDAKLHVFKGSSGAVPFFNAPLVVENSTHSYVNLLAPDDAETGILFGRPASNVHGGIIYNNSDNRNSLQFRTNGNITRMVLTDAGKLGLGTLTPEASLEIINPNQTDGILVRNTNIVGGNWIGVRAESQLGNGIGVGVYGLGSNVGVAGRTFESTFTGTAYGISGLASGQNGVGSRYGVWGSASGGAVNYAGYFDGNVYTTGSYLPSARQLKEDIRPLKDGLQQLLQLKPSTYWYKTSEYKQMALPEGKQMGLIADEVKQVFPELIKTAVQPEQHDWEDRTKIISPEVKFEALNYVGLIPVLIASVQELSKMNDEKDSELEAQQKQIDELKRMVIQLQQNFNSCNACAQTSVSGQQSIANNKLQTENLTSASLDQNIPNPFNHNTTIGYTLPQKFTSAQILITDKNGKALKAVKVSGSGKGSLKVNASTLASGAYQYSLLIDGKLIATKQMILAR